MVVSSPLADPYRSIKSDVIMAFISIECFVGNKRHSTHLSLVAANMAFVEIRLYLWGYGFNTFSLDSQDNDLKLYLRRNALIDDRSNFKVWEM